MADARLLQQILLHTGAFDHSVPVEEDLQILAEAAGVVIADGFGVPEGFQYGVRLQDQPLGPLLRHLAADRRQVPQDQLGALRLSSPRFPAGEERRIGTVFTLLNGSPHLMMQHWFCRWRIMRL